MTRKSNVNKTIADMEKQKANLLKLMDVTEKPNIVERLWQSGVDNADVQIKQFNYILSIIELELDALLLIKGKPLSNVVEQYLVYTPTSTTSTI